MNREPNSKWLRRKHSLYPDGDDEPALVRCEQLLTAASHRISWLLCWAVESDPFREGEQCLLWQRLCTLDGTMNSTQEI